MSRRRSRLETPFLVYCRTIGQGSGHPAACARACYRIGKHSPTTARRRLEEMLSLRLIGEESFRVRMDAVDLIEEMWDKGERTHTDPCTSAGGWERLGQGGHVRRCFVEQD